eukprot:2877548-Rhodomonas_salina.1
MSASALEVTRMPGRCETKYKHPPVQGYVYQRCGCLALISQLRVTVSRVAPRCQLAGWPGVLALHDEGLARGSVTS